MSEPNGMLMLQNLAVTGPAIALKIFLVTGLVMYTIFTLVVLKQVGVMTETFESDVNGTVKMFARAHVLMSLLLTVLSIIIL